MNAWVTEVIDYTKKKKVSDRDKVLRKISDARLKLLNESVKMVVLKQGLYKLQINQLKGLKSESLLIKGFKDLDKNIELVIVKKESALEEVNKQEAFRKGFRAGTEGLLPRMDKLFNDFVKEINFEASAIRDSNYIISVFMSSKDFVKRLVKTYKHINRKQRSQFYGEYMKYIFNMIEYFTNEKMETLNGLIGATEKKAKQEPGIAIVEVTEGKPPLEETSQEKMQNLFNRVIMLHSSKKASEELQNIVNEGKENVTRFVSSNIKLIEESSGFS